MEIPFNPKPWGQWGLDCRARKINLMVIFCVENPIPFFLHDFGERGGKNAKRGLIMENPQIFIAVDYEFFERGDSHGLGFGGARAW